MVSFPPKGYCQPYQIAEYLGTTPANANQVLRYIGNAEDFIDRTCRRGWLLELAPITNEVYPLVNVGISLLLRSRPVASVQSLAIRTVVPGDTPRTLIAGTDYELTNPALGLITLAASYDSAAVYSGYDDYGGSAIASEAGALLRSGVNYNSMALVSYTPATPVPGDIELATIQLVAHWLEFSIFPERYGLSRIKIDDLDITYGGTVGVRVIPAEVVDVLQSYRRLIL